MERVTEQRQNIGHAVFFLQEIFLPKSDSVIANSSDIFSAIFSAIFSVVYMAIHYL